MKKDQDRPPCFISRDIHFHCKGSVYGLISSVAMFIRIDDIRKSITFFFFDLDPELLLYSCISHILLFFCGNVFFIVYG